MAVVLVALVMASALMIAAFRAADVERKAEMVRAMRPARRGHFEPNRN
ncbi:MAG TPA: hypothetical protein VLQ68_07210 [Rhizobiaceae bacterium]|nr:hypothetical protein [Rhizobiaceae bacterium]